MQTGRCAGNVGITIRALPETKNLQTPANRRMKAFKTNPIPHTRNRLASSFSLTEKLPALVEERGDEHSQTGILTPNLSLAPAFPVSA
jgi:hypothetical protein